MILLMKSRKYLGLLKAGKLTKTTFGVTLKKTLEFRLNLMLTNVLRNKSMKT